VPAASTLAELDGAEAVGFTEGEHMDAKARAMALANPGALVKASCSRVSRRRCGQGEEGDNHGSDLDAGVSHEETTIDREDVVFYFMSEERDGDVIIGSGGASRGSRRGGRPGSPAAEQASPWPLLRRRRHWGDLELFCSSLSSRPPMPKRYAKGLFIGPRFCGKANLTMPNKQRRVDILSRALDGIVVAASRSIHA
jgi:hypothetical protein